MSETASANKWTKLLSGAVKFLPEAGWVGIVVELLTQLASSMGVTSGTSKETLSHMEGLHADLSRVTVAHAALSKQLTDQAGTLALHSEKLDALSVELHLVKLSADTLQTSINIRLRTLTVLVSVSLAATTVACILLLVLLLHHL